MGTEDCWIIWSSFRQLLDFLVNIGQADVFIDVIDVNLLQVLGRLLQDTAASLRESMSCYKGRMTRRNFCRSCDLLKCVVNHIIMTASVCTSDDCPNFHPLPHFGHSHIMSFTDNRASPHLAPQPFSVHHKNNSMYMAWLKRWLHQRSASDLHLGTDICRFHVRCCQQGADMGKVAGRFESMFCVLRNDGMRIPKVHRTLVVEIRVCPSITCNHISMRLTPCLNGVLESEANHDRRVSDFHCRQKSTYISWLFTQNYNHVGSDWSHF